MNYDPHSPPARYREHEYDVHQDKDEVPSVYEMYRRDDNNGSPRMNAPFSSSSRVRFLCVVFMVTILVMGAYFYHVSKEMDRISQPSILIEK